MHDQPFGFDTLTIPAALVSDGDPASAHAAVGSVGLDAVKLPAVLVPQGGTAPSGDYVMLGVMVRPRAGTDADTDAAPTARNNEVVAAMDPQTRYRVAGGQPPTPGSAPDPTTVGIRTLRGMRASGRVEPAPSMRHEAVLKASLLQPSGNQPVDGPVPK